MIHLETKNGEFMIYRLWIDEERKSFREDWQIICGTDIPEPSLRAKVFAVTDLKYGRMHIIKYDGIGGFITTLIEGVIK